MKTLDCLKLFSIVLASAKIEARGGALIEFPQILNEKEMQESEIVFTDYERCCCCEESIFSHFYLRSFRLADRNLLWQCEEYAFPLYQASPAFQGYYISAVARYECENDDGRIYG